MKHEIAGNFYTTKNYGIFKRLEGNRNVTELRKERIRKSIESVGYIENPIVVNDRMEIIDGQGRFEVLKEMGLPILYNIVNVKDSGKACIYMNVGTVNWHIEDYVNFYAEKGYSDYVMLQELYKKCKNLKIQSLIALSNGLATHSVNTEKKDSAKEGMFKITKNIEELEIKVEKIDNLLQHLKGKGNVDRWTSALSFAYDCPKIDFNLLENKIINNKNDISVCKDMPSAMDSLSNIYNFRKRGVIVNFLTEYLNSTKVKGNAVRYGWDAQ